tara:strand:+ start:2081 stop:2527 length:447 start_codon:yes stop_codon:yes gene_type:complete
MIKVNNEAICGDSECTNEFTKFRTTDKYCSWTCQKKNTKPKSNKKLYKIPKVSAKQKVALASYFKVRADFMNGLDSIICPVYSNKTVTDVHHKKGKEGFADEWAKENNIPLLIDVRYFLAVSRSGHQKIEENPIWAKERGFSIDRLSI